MAQIRCYKNKYSFFYRLLVAKKAYLSLCPYHFQHFSSPLDRFARQHNKASVNFKDEKRRSIPWGRSHLQTDCFEATILHAFSPMENWNLVPKMFSRSHTYSNLLSILEKPILYMIWPVNSNDRRLQSSHAMHPSSMTISKSGLPGFFGIVSYHC